MLIVLVDLFSKWTEMVPWYRTATAETSQKAFRERIVVKFLVPKGVISDKGVQFMSRAFKKYLSDMGKCSSLRHHTPRRRIQLRERIVL